MGDIVKNRATDRFAITKLDRDEKGRIQSVEWMARFRTADGIEDTIRVAVDAQEINAVAETAYAFIRMASQVDHSFIKEHFGKGSRWRALPAYRWMDFEKNLQMQYWDADDELWKVGVLTTDKYLTWQPSDTRNKTRWTVNMGRAPDHKGKFNWLSWLPATATKIMANLSNKMESSPDQMIWTGEKMVENMIKFWGRVYAEKEEDRIDVDLKAIKERWNLQSGKSIRNAIEAAKEVVAKRKAIKELETLGDDDAPIGTPDAIAQARANYFDAKHYILGYNLKSIAKKIHTDWTIEYGSVLFESNTLLNKMNEVGDNLIAVNIRYQDARKKYLAQVALQKKDKGNSSDRRAAKAELIFARDLKNEMARRANCLLQLCDAYLQTNNEELQTQISNRIDQVTKSFNELPKLNAARHLKNERIAPTPRYSNMDGLYDTSRSQQFNQKDWNHETERLIKAGMEHPQHTGEDNKPCRLEVIYAANIMQVGDTKNNNNLIIRNQNYYSNSSSSSSDSDENNNLIY